MSPPFASLLLAVKDFVEPLAEALSSLEQLEYCFYRFGWRISLDDQSFARLGESLQIVSAIEQFSTLASSVRSQMDSGTSDLVLLGQLADSAEALIRGVAALKPSALQQLPGALANEALWDDVADQLLDALFEEYLRVHQPAVHLTLYAGGCLNYQTVTPPDPARAPYVRPVFDWGRLGDLLQDFTGAFAATYRWGNSAHPLDHLRLFDVLDRLFHAMKARSGPLVPAMQLAPGLSDEARAKVLTEVAGLRAVFLDGYEPFLSIAYSVGLDILVGSDPPGGRASGLVLQPRLVGGAEQSFKLGEFFTLDWKLSADAGGLLGVTVFPSEVALAAGDVTLGASMQLTGKPQHPWLLAGDGQSARIELRNLSLGLRCGRRPAGLRRRHPARPGRWVRG
jgi:hypothetical protein